MSHRTSKDSHEEDDNKKSKLIFVLDDVDSLLGIDELISIPKISFTDVIKEAIEIKEVRQEKKPALKMEDFFKIDPDLAKIDVEEFKRQIKIQKDLFLKNIKKLTPKKKSKRSKKNRKGKNMEDFFGNLDNLDPELLKQTIQEKKEEYIRSIRRDDLKSNSTSDEIKPYIRENPEDVEILTTGTKHQDLNAFDDEFKKMNIDDLRLELNNRKKNYMKFAKRKRVSEIAIDLSLLELIISYISSKSPEFYNYKPSFIYRRIKKRISRLKLYSLSDYLEHLKVNVNEIFFLKIELSINVTQFMRDKSAWEYLETILLPKIFMENKRKIKIWSAATAIGCESYSIAIINHKNSNTNYEIISTDINDNLLSIARQGNYDPHHVKVFNKSELKQYFNYSDGRYKIKSHLQNNNRFYQLDLFSDIFPTNVDIILARNVWIYFEKPELIYMKMYNSLNCNGYLMLGGTEIVPTKFRHMFKLVNVSTQTYQKIC